MRFEEAIAVPYVIAVESRRGDDGTWRRRAWHPELPGCEVEAESALTAMEMLEKKRIECIRDLLATGNFHGPNRAPLLGTSAGTLDG